MRIFAIIAGLLVVSFGGGCLFLVDKWASGPVFVFGWLPVLAGLGLVGYSILHQRGKSFPLPIKIVVWLIVLGFVAAIVSILVAVFVLDVRMAG